MHALYDTHNHLQDFVGRPDFESLVTAARGVGVMRMVVNGSTEADWPVVAGLTARFPDLVVPAFGLHPWHIAGRSAEWCDRLVALLAAHPHAVVGEIGLDRGIADYDWDDQRGVFLEQWRLAVAMNRVPQVHCLKAYGHLEALLRAERKPVRGWVLHSYGGPPEMVPSFVKLGASFSFSGYFLHPRKIDDRAAAFRAVPRDRLLIETDAPDMAPPEGRRRFACPTGETGKPGNPPGNLVSVAEGLAELLGLPFGDLAELTTSNARRLFGG